MRLLRPAIAGLAMTILGANHASRAESAHQSSLRGASGASNEAISPFGITNSLKEIASSFASQKTRNDGAGRILKNEIASSFASQKSRNDGLGQILK